ncbi:MAG: dihydrodipicolinate synthase family protein [Planctomycetales bacterium]|nr:dihydrodipicolinate synthase family protein [Planctomycetales bacterium]
MSTNDERQQLIMRLFANGDIGRLWCPLLTHYTSTGHIDAARIASHFSSLASHLGGILLPGSTGDGWEMDGAERRQLLEVVLPIANANKTPVLIGILNTDANAALVEIEKTATWLRERTQTDDVLGAMVASGVCGFTVCPPYGPDLSQREILAGLKPILQFGFPIALYQLPQVTGNEMTPATVAELSREFPNFYAFKDTSGRDKVARTGLELETIFVLRGAEGQYADWLITAGGVYQGFLLSTANCFAAQLAGMIGYADHQRHDEARRLIEPIERVVAAVFKLVSDLPDGNAFTNANKAIDHFFAHGQAADEASPPRLHAGSSIQVDVLQAVREILRREGLLPATGYLTL